jgi:hypothetical protein
MTCAIALWVDKPFAEIDKRYGFMKAAELRMALKPTEEIVILVLRGFENIDKKTARRLADLKHRLIDASHVLAEVRASYSFANETRVWRGNSFHEMSFLRFLVLEKFFGDSPVLAMDSDIVWRVEPYLLLEKWKNGGSFLFDQSTCLVFIKGRSWYDSYRSGLSRLAADVKFGADFSRGGSTGLYHEQAMCQFLAQRGELENDASNIRAHGLDQYAFSANPLSAFPQLTRPLLFEQDATGERVNGKPVALWHMQSTFSRYLFTALLLPALTGRNHFRIPYERRTTQQPTNVAAEIFAHVYSRMLQDFVKFSGKLQRYNQFINRASQYEHFFNGNLARTLFTEDAWWQPGVWAVEKLSPHE